jgi:hypothetical protein
MTTSKKKRGVISLIVLALVSVLAVAGAADAKKKHHKPKKPKPVTKVSTQTAAIPAAAAPTFDGAGNELTPFRQGKAQTSITIPKKKNFPIKSVEVAAIVAPGSPSAHTIGVNLQLTGPSGASTFLNTPFFTPPGSFATNDPGSPAGVGYGSGTNCNGSPMRFTDNSPRNPASENPNAAFDDPGFAEFTSFPPYTSPVGTNLNSIFKGLNSKGTWRLTAFNPSTTATDTNTLVCWSLTLKPQKLAKGESA